jgi:CRP/FNR family nitrogen fixation transcriptional regulator
VEDKAMLAQAAIRAGSFRNLTRASAENHELGAAVEFMGAPMWFPRNGEIYCEGEPADYLYKVASGTVRTYKLLADGRRQVGGFYLPGDIFGLEPGEGHTFSAEAIGECSVLVIERSALIALAERDHNVARQLWTLTSDELQRVQGHILLLIKSAEERVAAFLLEMADRVAAGNAVELPMSRQDIADYLGLTIETVSRTLTHLQSASAIELSSSRRIVLRNRSALSRLNA